MPRVVQPEASEDARAAPDGGISGGGAPGGFQPGAHVRTDVPRKVPEFPDAALLSASEDVDLDRRRYTGKVAAFYADRGFGFIRCPEMVQRYGRDVFVHKGPGVEVRVGDTVSFGVALVDGCPQARELRAADKAELDLAADIPVTADVIPGVTDQRFTGAVARFLTDAYFGHTLYAFLACPELQTLFDNDVFVPAAEIGTSRIGDTVTFDV